MASWIFGFLGTKKKKKSGVKLGMARKTEWYSSTLRVDGNKFSASQTSVGCGFFFKKNYFFKKTF
jgi:hypothetical protein